MGLVTTEVGTRRSRRAAAPRPGRRPVGAGVVGVVGELLITAGVLLGLFVVWQLFWTDVVAERAHDQIVQELGWARTGDPAARAPEPVETEPVETEPVETEPVGTEQERRIAAHRTTRLNGSGMPTTAGTPAEPAGGEGS